MEYRRLGRTGLELEPGESATPEELYVPHESTGLK